VLVIDTKSAKQVLYSLGYWTGTLWWIDSQITDISEQLKPTHWMHLPKSPEKL
jgi:hypothetical protein